MSLLFWLYFINAVFLINHEIDSAYWKEWDLFELPGSITGFLIIHFPLLSLVLYGLVQVQTQTFTGLIFSIILSSSGVFAFIIHTYFIKKGHQEFKTPISQFILISTFIISLIQFLLTIYLISNRISA